MPIANSVITKWDDVNAVCNNDLYSFHRVHRKKHSIHVFYSLGLTVRKCEIWVTLKPVEAVNRKKRNEWKKREDVEKKINSISHDHMIFIQIEYPTTETLTMASIKWQVCCDESIKTGARPNQRILMFPTFVILSYVTIILK